MYRASHPPKPPPPPVRARTQWSLVRYVLVVAACVATALAVASRFMPARPRPVAVVVPVPHGTGLVHIPALRANASATVDGRAIEVATAAPSLEARGCWRLPAGDVDRVRCQLPAGESHLFEAGAPGATPDRWRIVVPSDSRTVTLVP